MAAITWRNVNGPDLAASLRGFYGATNTINSGFENLQKAFNSYQGDQRELFSDQKEANTQAFLNRLSQFRTPEELAAAQASGELANLQASYGNAIDQAQVRGAAENRINVLRDQVLKTQQYDQQQLAQKWNPVGDQLTALANSEDADVRKSARDALMVYAQNGMPNTGKLQSDFVNADRGVTRFGWDKNQEVRSEEAHDSRLKTDASQRATAAQQRTLTQLNIDDKEEDRQARTLLSNAFNMSQGREFTDGTPTPKLLEGAVAALASQGNVNPRVLASALEKARASDTATYNQWSEYQKENGVLGPDVIGNPSAAVESLNKVISEGKYNEDDAELVRIGAGKYIRDGYVIPKGAKLSDGSYTQEEIRVFPTSNLIRRQLTGIDGNTGWNWQIQGNVEDAIEKGLRDPAYLREYASRLNATDRARFLAAMPKPKK